MLSNIEVDFWLPDEIWLKVFLSLHSQDNVTVMAVSTRFYCIANDNQIWQTYLLRDFGLDKKNQLVLASILNIRGGRVFKKIYKFLYHFPSAEARKSLIAMINDLTIESQRYELIRRQIIDLETKKTDTVNVIHYFQKRKHAGFLNFIFAKVISHATSIYLRLMFEIHCYQPLSANEAALRELVRRDSKSFLALVSHAAAAGNLKALKYLIRIAKDEINKFEGENLFLFEPIRLAATWGYKPIMQHIYKMLNKTKKCYHSAFWSNPLEIAVAQGHTKIVHMLLHRGKTQLVKENAIGPALVQACWQGNLSIARLLLAAKKELIDFNDGYTPLMAAVINGHYPLVNYLLAQGADIDIQASFWGADSENALRLAVRFSHRNIVQLLLSCRATAPGLRAFREAMQKRYFKIAQDIIYDLPADIAKQQGLITPALSYENEKLLELVIACQGNIKFDLGFDENDPFVKQFLQYTDTPLNYAYKVKPKLIDSVFRGIARLKLADARIALNKVHINLLAQLLRFIHECEIKYHIIARPSLPTLFMLPNVQIPYNRYALNAAKACVNVMLAYAPAVTLDSFLPILRGNHPILTPIYLSLQAEKIANDCTASPSAPPRLS